MLSTRVGDLIEKRKLVVAAPDTSVARAAGMMKKHEVGAVLVVEQGRLVGIFTERDAVYRVMAAGLQPHATLLREVMTREPVTVAPDELLGTAMLLMHEHGFRHAPVVEDGRPIGVVSARKALDPDLEEFSVEAARRKSYRRVA
ncbi:MAG: CBS domain-containing protein [Betaproteobacteria bacterium]|nr:CBS domain-containing protein [Betaproteobacteria bacterium]MDH5223080.1 CBS domain-containing protein [Betaproteobacteria bacterium]MDH5351775.1 CBS domain-containing protein [Betaproteobacteria bacterium]